MKLDYRLGRHTATYFDQFYTKDEVAKECVALIKKTADLSADTLWIEPSAGGGAFLRGLDSTDHFVAYDIEPRSNYVIPANFLTIHLETDLPNTVVFGNPPFGHAANLAVTFFNYSTNFADTIAFIVPRSFKKDSVQARLNLQYWLMAEMDIPRNSFFTAPGQPYDNVQQCIFQVWQKCINPREVNIFHDNPFIAITPKEVAQLAIRRAGARAGEVVDIKTSAVSSTLFFRLKLGITLDQALNAIERADLTSGRNNTASVRSVSASEIHKALSILENQ